MGALVIDLRYSLGGYDSMVQLLASFLLPPGTVLHRVYDRMGEELQIVQTYPVERAGKLRNIPVYVLTSDSTRSAAEAFAYGLKHFRRGKIVGQHSAGAGFAAVVDEYDLDVFKLEVMLPSMKVVSSATGSSWEGTGVNPDLRVSSEQALDEALDNIRRVLRIPASGD